MQAYSCMCVMLACMNVPVNVLYKRYKLLFGNDDDFIINFSSDQILTLDRVCASEHPSCLCTIAMARWLSLKTSWIPLILGSLVLSLGRERMGLYLEASTKIQVHLSCDIFICLDSC